MDPAQTNRTLFHAFWVAPLGLSVVLCACVWALGLHANLWPFYAGQIRASLFSGFLSAGGFLLALKTFILIKMKEEVYGTPAYRERYDRAKKRNNVEPLYEPLRRLGGYLFLAIVAAFTTAGLQLTLGLWPHWIAALTCIGSAMFATCMLFVCLYFVKRNLGTWFELLEGQTENTPAPAQGSGVGDNDPTMTKG